MAYAKYLLYILTLLLLPSCTYRVFDFTIVSTKNLPIGSREELLTKGEERVSGTDKAHMALWFPLGTPSMKEAIDRAIEQNPGAVGLVDGVVYQKMWSCFFYGQNSYIVEGTPLYLTQARDGGDDGPQQIIHTVRKGDSLSKIAQTYGVSIPELLEWNNLPDVNLRVGMKLIVYVK